MLYKNKQMDKLGMKTQFNLGTPQDTPQATHQVTHLATHPKDQVQAQALVLVLVPHHHLLHLQLIKRQL